MNYSKLFRYTNPRKVLDIGAHIGEFSQQVKRFNPEADVLMIEANPNCEPYLNKLNIPYQMIALSKEKGEAELFVEKVNEIGTGASLYRENTQYYADDKFDTVKVHTDSLDNLNYFEDQFIDLVKLDVQGAEYDILEGGRKTITRSGHVLIEVSLLEYNLGAPQIEAVVNKMKEYGFMIEDILDYQHSSENILFQLDILFKNSYIY
jgi:FkbM family methyltransferase